MIIILIKSQFLPKQFHKKKLLMRWMLLNIVTLEISIQ